MVPQWYSWLLHNIKAHYRGFFPIAFCKIHNIMLQSKCVINIFVFYGKSVSVVFCFVLPWQKPRINHTWEQSNFMFVGTQCAFKRWVEKHLCVGSLFSCAIKYSNIILVSKISELFLIGKRCNSSQCSEWQSGITTILEEYTS
jgi:hypothetical protein